MYSLLKYACFCDHCTHLAHHLSLYYLVQAHVAQPSNGPLVYNVPSHGCPGICWFTLLWVETMFCFYTWFSNEHFRICILSSWARIYYQIDDFHQRFCFLQMLALLIGYYSFVSVQPKRSASVFFFVVISALCFGIIICFVRVHFVNKRRVSDSRTHSAEEEM